MDFEDVEDLLFSTPDSQDPLTLLWTEESDDETHSSAVNDYEPDDDLFDTTIQTSPDSWQLLSSPLLTAAEEPGSSTKDISMAIRNIGFANLDKLSVEVGKDSPRDRHWVIARIESMLESIVDGLLEGRERLTFTLTSRAGISRRLLDASERPKVTPVARARVISFPGSTAQEAWNFTVFLRIIELIHGGLVDNTIMTKRDIYYRHPDLFVKQAVVDRYVDDLACTLGISSMLKLQTAAAKGLVAGCFLITREDGTQVDGMDDEEGILVPKIGERDQLDVTRVRWFLVIEKEATFRSILSTAQWKQLRLCGVVLTAKGYPDVASRKFLRHLANHAPHVPIYALVDLDPDGIAILSIYKYGSYRLAHEDVAHKDTPALSLPNMQWLGIKRIHISQIPVTESDADTKRPELQGLMRLTARDRIKAARMLEWDLCCESGPEQEWRQELQTMLMLNVKAEMQILDEMQGGMISMLSHELERTEQTRVEMVAGRAGSEDGLLF